MGKKPISILVLDDEESLVDIYVQVIPTYLPEFSFKIYTTKDGDEALRIIRTFQDEISLLVTDINHPGMGCLELLPIIKRDFPAMNILIVTALGGIEQCEILAEVMHKPVGLKDFVETVKKYIS